MVRIKKKFIIIIFTIQILFIVRNTEDIFLYLSSRGQQYMDQGENSESLIGGGRDVL